MIYLGRSVNAAKELQQDTQNTSLKIKKVLYALQLKGDIQNAHLLRC